MEDIIEYLDLHSGAYTFLITSVYVLATIAICVFNYRSAKASKEQVDYMKKEYKLMNQPHINVTFDMKDLGLFCFVIENDGKAPARKR